MLKAVSMRSAYAILAAVAMAGAALGQAATPPTQQSKSGLAGDSAESTSLSFEVASIKPSGPFDPARLMGIKTDRDRVDMGQMSLMVLIQMAYKVKPDQIAGNPAWLNGRVDADRFDISAKMPEGAKRDQWAEMLQSLLAERFKLAAHREKRDTPVYALTVGKGGPKLKEAPPDDSGMTRTYTTIRENGIRIETDTTMEGLVRSVSDMTDRPVVDMTGLKGKYKISLDVSGDSYLLLARKTGLPVSDTNAGMVSTPGSPSGAALEPPEGSIFTALQQLGLKLERRTLPYEFLVIDHVERTPTEN